MNYLAFLFIVILIGIPGGVLMRAGDRRFVDGSITPYEKRRRKALPFYAGGVFWIGAVFTAWFVGSLHWVIS